MCTCMVSLWYGFSLFYFQDGANSGHGLEGVLGGDVNLPVVLMYLTSSNFTVS